MPLDDDVERYMYLVRAVAREICDRVRGYDLDDAVSDGAMALIDALRRFDAGYGVKFETYARRRIRGAIFDGVRRMRPESRRACRGVVIWSIDAPMDDAPMAPRLLQALTVDATAEASAVAADLLERALSACTPVQRLAVDLRFRADMPLKRLARALGCEVPYVQFLIRSALRRMRMACGVEEIRIRSRLAA